MVYNSNNIISNNQTTTNLKHSNNTISNQLCDDDMMVEMAKSIRAGKWLGNYTSNTLVKGPVFPIILAIINYFDFHISEQ